MIQLIGIIGDQGNGMGWNGEDTLRAGNGNNLSLLKKEHDESALYKYVQSEAATLDNYPSDKFPSPVQTASMKQNSAIE